MYGIYMPRSSCMGIYIPYLSIILNCLLYAIQYGILILIRFNKDKTSFTINGLVYHKIAF